MKEPRLGWGPTFMGIGLGVALALAALSLVIEAVS